MVKENQITVLTEEGIFVCNACDDRTFSSHNNLLHHCRTAKTHTGEWCESCEWLFVAPNALTSHLRDSPNHWICSRCQLDADDEEDLETHMALSHSWCYDCDSHFTSHREHRVEIYNRCATCDREFETSNELFMHQKSHESRDEECFGCDRKFKSISGIILHLDRDGCRSGVTQDDVNAWAFDHPSHRQYTNDETEDCKYRCPTCDNDFPELSALYQHLEGRACDADHQRTFDNLTGYLRNQISRRLAGQTGD